MIKFITTCGLLLFLATLQLHSQGCVAIQGTGCSNAHLGSSNSAISSKGNWVVSTDYRYFKSFRHFRGDHEEANRLENNTEVINKSHIVDLGMGFGLTDKLLISLNIPLLKNDRSSLYEHYGNSLEANPNQERFHTSSSGIGDIRISALYWLNDPLKAKQNLAIGLGVKAPTGNPHAKDIFHKRDEDGNPYTLEKPVDQSIQLGDGGWGIIIQSQGYKTIFNAKAALFYSGFYMMNTKNTNNTLRNPGADPSDPWNYFAAPDQYGLRYGLNYFINPKWSVGLGNLIEGVPATDLISGSDGYRRPGYVVSVEPSLGFMSNGFNFNLSLPTAVYRNRIKSTWDKANNRHGDAAFADYLINLRVSYRINTKNGFDKEKGKEWHIGKD